MKKSVKKILKRYPFIYNIVRHGYGWGYRLFLHVCGNVFGRLPIQRAKVTFDNFGGQAYAGYPRIIAEEIMQQGRQWDLVWLSASRPADLPVRIRWVRYGSVKACYEMSTARVWIDNIRNAIRPPKRRGQYYIQTWHGSGVGIKKSEADAMESLEKQYIKMSKLDSEITDLILSASEWETDYFKRAFSYSGNLMEVEFYGIVSPEEKKKIGKHVKDYFGIDTDANIILYAPTFRNDAAFDYYNLDYCAVLEALRKRFGGVWCMIARLHPNAMESQNAVEYSDKLVNGTPYPQIQDLIMAASFLMTDYSCLLFHAIRYGTKTLIHASDYEDYVKKERGLYFDLKNLPSPFSVTKHDLIQNILNFDENSYDEKCRQFVEAVGYYSDSKTVYLVADKISEVIKKN